jgi:transcriptional regulator GlxA family with amidase domain
VVFPRRPGGQSQFSSFLKHWEVRSRPDIEELQTWMLGNPGKDLSVQSLADRMGMSQRNFARLFHSETGTTPALFAERARADAARCKLEQSLLPIETIAEAMPSACGAHFNAISKSVRTTTGRGFNQPCLRDTGDEAPTFISLPRHAIVFAQKKQTMWRNN